MRVVFVLEVGLGIWVVFDLCCDVCGCCLGLVVMFYLMSE